MLNLFVRLSCALSLTASLVAAASFSGSVVDSGTGKPIAGAIITLGSKVVRADPKGEFKVDGDGS